MTEKTYPVNVGERERIMITRIQLKIKETMDYPVTQRAVVTRAIQRMYNEIFAEADKG